MKQWLHKCEDKQTRLCTHTESIVLYLRRFCVCLGVFIYFGVGVAGGWIVWVCLCCLSFLFGVFKETQHSKFFLLSLSLSLSLSFFLFHLNELCCVAAFLKVRCGFWHSFELTVASHGNADAKTEQVWRKHGTTVFRLFLLCVYVCLRESSTSCLHFSGPLRQWGNLGGLLATWHFCTLAEWWVQSFPPSLCCSSKLRHVISHHKNRGGKTHWRYRCLRVSGAKAACKYSGGGEEMYRMY